MLPPKTRALSLFHRQTSGSWREASWLASAETIWHPCRTYSYHDIATLTLSCPTNTFVDFTLSNARRFYSSMGNPLGRKGLRLTPKLFPLLSAEDYQEITSTFTKNRAELPALFIATPKDKLSSLWTKEKPSKQVCEFIRRLSFPFGSEARPDSPKVLKVNEWEEGVSLSLQLWIVRFSNLLRQGL